MRHLRVLALALVFTFTVASAATASGFQVYGEYGFNVEQSVGDDLLPSDWDVTSWGAGVSWEMDPWLIGVDHMSRSVVAPWFDPDALATIRTYDLYAGYQILGADRFKLHGLVGYISNDVLVDLTMVLPVEIEVSAAGWMVGARAELTVGSFVFEGRLLHSICGSAEGVLAIILSNDLSVELAHEFDGGTIQLLEARCTWMLSDFIGIYGEFHCISMRVEDDGSKYDVGQGIWLALGVSLNF